MYYCLTSILILHLLMRRSKKSWSAQSVTSLCNWFIEFSIFVRPHWSPSRNRVARKAARATQLLPVMLQDTSSLVLATVLLACTAPLGSDGGAGGPRVVKYTPVDPRVMQSEFDASRRARGTDPIGIDQLNAWWEER